VGIASPVLRLLIAEDCESDADLILLNLESAGYAVSSARVQSAEAMREAMGRERWDAVISDYSMPGFSVQTALSIKNGIDPDIPFIVVSGTVPEETAVELMKAGAHDYLMKNKLIRLAPVLKREIMESEVRRKRKLAESSLKEREARYRNLIGNIPDMIYSFSLRYGVLFCSPRVESMLGYSQEELIADPDLRRSLVHPEDRPSFDKSMADCDLGKHYDLEYRILDRTGNERWLHDRSIKISPSGEDSIVDGIASDITERKRMETEVLKSNLDLSSAYDATIQGWSRALDLRDKETEGHTICVAEMTVALAKSFALGAEEILQIQRGALLHDIGKMGVPDAILLKPGPLTGEEWELMKRHPAYAYELLSPIQYLRPALDIPYCHHEKWDGSGYPRGLAGEQIPLAARIFAIVDVWDALRSDRPYRPAWEEARVIEHIRSLSGSHFDPRVVELFLRSHAGRI
jgi:PAS domain S-box-containing protein